jgi:hypothetical protein
MTDGKLIRRALAAAFCGLAFAGTTATCVGQATFEGAPIRYLDGQPCNRVAELQARSEAGTLPCEYDARRGYLPALLKLLDIDPATQMLVFSKTSFQLRLIAPQTPRALYFNDDVYVGYVPGGDVTEISVADPQFGAVFYTVDQAPATGMRFVRRTHECLQCHSSSVTQGVPGHLVRSVFPDREGHPILRAGSFVTTHESPFAQRWGGWYVTGTHGQQQHMGNSTMERGAREDQFDRSAGANVTDLNAFCDVTPYMQPHSDLVALMVLEHQSHVHNLITAANFQTRLALHDERVINEMLGRPQGEHSASTLRRIRNASEKLVEGLLLSREATLQSPVSGTSDFARAFSARGPRDSQGRSLRDFDLQRRLFKYPCSYLVYSAAFDGLPAEAKDCVYQRLEAILTAPVTSDQFVHLSADDRRAVREILRETKPEFVQAGAQANAGPQVK